MLSSTSPTSPLHSNGQYACPVCRRGQISALSLMDAFGCNFCRHIFAANWEKQSVQMVDSELPLTWQWNGQTWRGLHREGVEFGWGYWLAGIALVIFPTTIVGLGAYLFPPLPGTPLAWFPLLWTGLTFCAHLMCLLWLVAEYYQFPVLLYLRAMSANSFFSTSD
ncbi:MAG: hypothetical protein ACOC3E_01095 [Cyanobacteriota bacterium]